MAMPSLTDLQGMYGLGNPMAYTQARDNADLERQYREQQYAQEQAKAQEASLKNIWATEDRPRDIEKQTLSNRNLDYAGLGTLQDNRSKTVKANIDEGTQQFKLNEAQRVELLAVSNQDIAMGRARAIKMLESLDPKEHELGKKLFDFSEYATKEKLKHEQATKLAELKEAGDTKRTGMNNATTLAGIKLNQEGQNTRAAAKAAKSTGALDIMAALQSGRVSPANAAVALNAKAAIETDEEDKNMYLTLARIAETMHRQGPAPAGGGKIDVQGVPRTEPAPLATPAPKGNLNDLKAPVLPEGAKKIGTSGGKDVYQLPDGRKVIAQ